LSAANLVSWLPCIPNFHAPSTRFYCRQDRGHSRWYGHRYI
jgi:hypothetical protein